MTLIKLNSRCCCFICWIGLVLFVASMALAQAQGPQALNSSLQMVVVTTPDWDTVAGSLTRYERMQAGARWKRVGKPVVIVVGKNGMGWGAGLAPTDGPGLRGEQDPVKKEGDGKSPAGVFGLGTGFGYAAQAPSGWKLPYIYLTPTIECVDDAASRYYNHIVDRAAVSADWHSSEHMSEAGRAYRWGTVIEQNMNPVTQSGGSCVFMHVWGGAGVGTAGCTAMPQELLEPILAWLDPARRPVLVQMPRAQYKLVSRLWGLPRLPGS